jgi:hemoglobin
MTRTMLQRSAIAVFAVVLLAACAAREPSLYQRLGGTPGIAAVMDSFVDNVRADPMINKRFAGADIPHTKQMLTELFCKATGGPCEYTGRSLKDIHRGMDISDPEFNAMAADLTKTLDTFKLPDRERREVMNLFNSLRGDVVGM